MKRYVVEVLYPFDDEWRLITYEGPWWTFKGANRFILRDSYLFDDVRMRVRNTKTDEAVIIL